MSVVTLAPGIAKINLVFKQGAGAKILLTVVDSAGQPIMDPSGCRVRASIKNITELFLWDTADPSSDGVVSLTYSSVTNKSVLVLSVSGSQTAGFNFWSARWDCFLTMPGHEPSCLAEGSVGVDPATTI
jgi:hypothetical protein